MILLAHTKKNKHQLYGSTGLFSCSTSPTTASSSTLSKDSRSFLLLINTEVILSIHGGLLFHGDISRFSCSICSINSMNKHSVGPDSFKIPSQCISTPSPNF